MTTKKERFLGHENARKMHKKGLAKKWSFIDNCLIIMKLHQFLMYPAPPFFHAKICA
jgi:hypothetical protein